MHDKDTAPRLLIDLNSILVGAILGGKDPDAHTTIVDGKVVSVNTARYGVDKFFDRFVEVLRHFNTAPRNVIGVWDGKNAKLYRQGILPAYKASTRSGPEYEQINKAREIVSQMLHDLGAHTVVCDGCEGDDTIAYLTKHMRTRKNIVVTGDGDLMVLVDDNTHVYRNGKLDENPYGPFPHQYITVYKALVGDTSDKIPGAKGFGDGAFVKLVQTFGLDGLELMEGLIRDGKLADLQEDVGELKVLQKIIDNQAEVTASWKVARVYPDRVNTLQRPLQWRAGMVKQWHDLSEDQRVDELQGFYGTCTLVHAGNYSRVKELLREGFEHSPFVALDIETSVPEESLEWLERTASKGGSGVMVDVLGSKLTGMSLTFGANTQHTIYITVDHASDGETVNCTSAQARELVELIPQEMHTVVQNRAFEFPVLHNEWGEAWKDNGWYGFIPNAIDTKIGASYVDENHPLGLKQRSKLHLGYEQQTYEETTTFTGLPGTLPPGGQFKGTVKVLIEEAKYEQRRVLNEDGEPVLDEAGEQAYEDVLIAPAVFEEHEKRQYQMNELTAKQVFGYGCDDTIVTAALHTWYRIVMELENTWHIYLEVEQLPEYLTSLAFLQGVPIDMGKLRQMENEDRAALAEHEARLNQFLIDNGWDGTTLPQVDATDPALIKKAVNIILGPMVDADGELVPFTSRKRKPEAIAQEILEIYGDNPETAALVANILKAKDTAQLQKQCEERFTGKPNINFGSPKQMQKLLYEVIGMQMRVFNKLTPKQRDDEKFRRAFYSKRDYDEGKITTPPDEYTLSVWRSKVSTDDDAVELALFRDNLPEDKAQVLKSFLKIKEINTRISLFYNTYSVIPHWKTGRIHSSMNQCQAVTRRYSSSDPNLQQLPSRGEGIKFRTLLKAMKDYVYVSMDFSSQELRLMAEQSQDAGMLSSFVGDNLTDNHSLIAVRAAPMLWGEEISYEDFMAMRKSEDPAVSKRASELRGDAKTVNFASAYGAQAPKIAIGLKVEEEVAQAFLDAKDRAFPGINLWKAKVEREVEDTGLAYTMLGARRHLASSVQSDRSWERSKAARQGPNFCIQGSGAEQAKLVMARLWKSGLFTGKTRAQFVAPIHDEIVFLVHRDDAVEVMQEAHRMMTQKYATMEVPVVSEVSVGRDFSCPIELGTEVVPEQAREAVNSLFAN